MSSGRHDRISQVMWKMCTQHLIQLNILPEKRLMFSLKHRSRQVSTTTMQGRLYFAGLLAEIGFWPAIVTQGYERKAGVCKHTRSRDASLQTHINHSKLWQGFFSQESHSCLAECHSAICRDQKHQSTQPLLP